MKTNNIIKCCTTINNIRMQGGTYTVTELANALKGIPYNGYIPTAMRANPEIPGIEILEVGIKFDKCKPIYKESILYLLQEAKKLRDLANHKAYAKRRFLALLDKPLPKTPVQLKNAVFKRSVELYYEGKCAEVNKLNAAYEAYVNIC